MPANVVYARYFFDSFLMRIADSNYKDKFILKGGLLLSSILGIEFQSTLDIDFSIKQTKMQEDIISNIFKEICSLPANDNIDFKYIGISKIRTEDIYGGRSVKILGRLENIRQLFEIDIATGDPITPNEIIYPYKCLLTGEEIRINAYNMETVVAEKVQTLLQRRNFNSRAKDFYDLYMIDKTYFNSLNLNILKEAFKATCHRRSFEISYTEAIQTLNEINTSNIIIANWRIFSQNKAYAKGISLNDVFVCNSSYS